MVDRVKLGNGKSSRVLTPTLPSDYASFKALCEAGNLYLDVSPNNATSGSDIGVSVVGTALNKANLLAETTATSLGLGSASTPNDALAALVALLSPLAIANGGTGATNATTALNNLLASATQIVLQDDVHYYDSTSDLPAAGVAGRIAFVKA